MTTWELIATGSIFIGYLIAIIGVFEKLSVKNTENTKDILSLRKEFDEYRVDTRANFDEVKQSVKDERQENRHDHEQIMDAISQQSEKFDTFKNEVINGLRRKRK